MPMNPSPQTKLSGDAPDFKILALAVLLPYIGGSGIRKISCVVNRTLPT